MLLKPQSVLPLEIQIGKGEKLLFRGDSQVKVAVAQESKLSSNWKIGGLIPGSSSRHVNVSLGKTLAKLLPMIVPTVHECVNEWVNVTYCVKRL